MRRRQSTSAPPWLSQHFLRSPRLCRQLADAAGVTAGEHALDIGAGRGLITAALLSRGAKVTAIEADARLAERLHGHFARSGDVTIRGGDFLKYPLPNSPFKVVANLPFHVTSQALRHLLDRPETPLICAALIVEWGYACGVTAPQRMTREAIGWTPWYSIALVRRLDPHVFSPPPQVDAGVITFMRREQPLVPNADAPAFRAWLRRSFKAGNVALKTQLRGHLSPRRFVALANDMGFPTNARPCDLDAWQWTELYCEMVNRGRDRESE